MEKNETKVEKSIGFRLYAWLLARLITLTHVYVTFLFAWAILRFFFQDRWVWLSLLSGFAIYFFLVLIPMLIVALLARHRVMWFSFALALSLWLFLYGNLFLPRLTRTQAHSSELTVMTYNLLGYNLGTEGVITALRESDADVIGLTELNLEIAAAIERDLIDLYPYQLLDPQPRVFGMGTISRYPIWPTGEILAGDRWIGDPQILEIDFRGTPVIFLNFHAIASGFRGDFSIATTYMIDRHEQAQAVADYVATREEPLIAIGDLNSTAQNKEYEIITAELTDAWRVAGWGLGHTTTATSPYKKLQAPIIMGVPVTLWTKRIDYIFYSDEWQTEKAWIGPWDGGSDHRPVTARLLLVD